MVGLEKKAAELSSSQYHVQLSLSPKATLHLRSGRYGSFYEPPSIDFYFGNFDIDPTSPEFTVLRGRSLENLPGDEREVRTRALLDFSRRTAPKIHRLSHSIEQAVATAADTSPDASALNVLEERYCSWELASWLFRLYKSILQQDAVVLHERNNAYVTVADDLRTIAQFCETGGRATRSAQMGVKQAFQSKADEYKKDPLTGVFGLSMPDIAHHLPGMQQFAARYFSTGFVVSQ